MGDVPQSKQATYLNEIMSNSFQENYTG